jgi:hypothetical protein
MKSFIFSILAAFMLTGCDVTYNVTPETQSLYIVGDYGWVVHDQTVEYMYEHYVSGALYLETPYLERGTKVYIDIYNDYNYAYITVENGRLYLSDQWFDGAYEAHYVFEVGESGYHYFQIGDLHRDTAVHIYYQ